jgi:hypothetical protein
MQHTPLDNPKNEIRVLRFLDLSKPVSIEEPIRCSIDNVPLEYSPHFQSQKGGLQKQPFPVVWDVFTKCVDLRDSTLEQTKLDRAMYTSLTQRYDKPSVFRYAWGDFEALSYTWGTGPDTKRICVNEIDIDVPSNLEQALRALRDLEETRLGICYWVDWLCINQGDRKEKSEQVKRMRDIYGQARAVIVWLGQEEKTDKTALETMCFLSRNPWAENTLQLLADMIPQGWSALFAFTKKTYWTRSWIIQELAVNHNSTLFLCGKLKLTRRMVRLGAVYCKDLLQTSEDLSYRFNHDLDPDAWRMASRMYRLVSVVFNPDVGLSLDHLLNLARRADATIEKDKVYSILGLLDPAVAADVTPDYSLSEQQVYTEFIVSIVRRLGSLDHIMSGGIPTCEGWPSWVPDWRQSFGRHHIKHLRCRQASGDVPAKVAFPEKNGGNCKLLICEGFQVDAVDGIAPETPANGKFIQASTTSHRYGDQIRKTLQQTLLVDHPGSKGELLLEIPWISECNTYKTSANSASDSGWFGFFHSSYYKRFHEFRENNQNFRIGDQIFRDFFPQSARKIVDISSMLRCMRLALLSLEQRALITTKTGYLGLAPVAVRPGDVIAVLFGSNCPAILRPYGDDLYHVVGECYIHGLMDGEVLKQEVEENVIRREFVLC